MLHATDHKQREGEGTERGRRAEWRPSHKEQLISLPKWRTHFKATRLDTTRLRNEICIAKGIGFLLCFLPSSGLPFIRLRFRFFYIRYLKSYHIVYGHLHTYIHISLFYATRKMLKLISGHKYGLQIGLIECNSSCFVWWSSIRPIVPVPCGQWVIFISFSLPPSPPHMLVVAQRFVRHIKYLVVQFVSTVLGILEYESCLWSFMGVTHQIVRFIYLKRE